MKSENVNTSGNRRNNVLWQAIEQHFLVDEDRLMSELLAGIEEAESDRQQIQTQAQQLILAARKKISHGSGLQALLTYYDLSTQEGVVLMCLAEALLRIPDNATVDALIADKLTTGQWQQHLGQSDSLFVNASTWAMMFSGRLLKQAEDPEHFVTRLVNRLDAPLLRSAIRQAMQLIAEQFVMGPDIAQALSRTQQQNQRYLYSYDMLGEAALTADDAERYQQAYLNAISAMGEQADPELPIHQRASISVKLSALYPRYEVKQQTLAIEVISLRLLELAQAAMQAGICLTVDAEEADRLSMSLQIFENVYWHQTLEQWSGLGLAVQAYQKRALPVLKYLTDLASCGKRQISVRLVKGAYWDTEIKRAQQQGLSDYPVFTQKNNTDVSYLVCVYFLLVENDWLYPQFATHNAYTVATILQHGVGCHYEFQRLHGMGEPLFEQLLTDMAQVDKACHCRVYAPVGAHQDLLPYLVRRLLENGANSSFVNQLSQADTSLEEMTVSPCQQASEEKGGFRNSQLVVPSQLFGEQRENSMGINFADCQELQPLMNAVTDYLQQQHKSQAIINGKNVDAEPTAIINPAKAGEVIGSSKILSQFDGEAINQALTTAVDIWPAWNNTTVEERANILDMAADLLEKHRAELIGLCVKETGKTLFDSHNDVREAIDFLRYYAQLAVKQMAEPQLMPGFTGETNELSLHGRGVFLCISPWNFPVAIFTGQIAAALVTGNCVLAKPSSLATLTAQRVTELMYQAGIPAAVLHYLPCDAKELSAAVLQDQRLAGVAFTGSCQVARHINQQLAQRDGAIATLIAETGGQNALVADSSAQPQQLVKDVMTSAFNSAGQRCSALRVLYVQREIADQVVELLTGAMDQLIIGDPLEIKTDIGPVINRAAQQNLNQHIENWQKKGALLHQCQMPEGCSDGFFIAPAMIEIEHIGQLQEEHFGPILHVIRYDRECFDEILTEINNSGYGLTFGFHSRIDHSIAHVKQQVCAGNLYINRDTIGAVVGAQPFGGQALSGTGPKAGGPHYLLRFTAEQTCTVNTTAVGGNALLLNQLI